MGNLSTVAQGGQGYFGVAPTPNFTQPQQNLTQAYPPAPKVQHQNKPTEISMQDFKYNAINVDQLKLNITSRQGFDGVTPDMLIWNFYKYNVTDLHANAEENELSKFVEFNLKDKGIDDVKIDFHPGNRVTLSGKYPLMGVPIPFSANVKITTTSNDKVMLTIEDFKTGFHIPDKLKETLIGLLINKESDTHNGMVPTSPSDAFSLADAMYRVGSNQIVIDFNRMKVPLDLPIKEIKTSETGFSVVGGISVTQSPQLKADNAQKTADRLQAIRQGGLPSLSQIRQAHPAPAAPAKAPVTSLPQAQQANNDGNAHPQLQLD